MGFLVRGARRRDRDKIPRFIRRIARTLLDRGHRGSAGRFDIPGTAHRRCRQAAAIAGRPGRAWPGAGSSAGRRMHRVRKSLRLSPDHAVDPEHPGRRPQNLSGRRIQTGRHRAAPQFRAKPDRRNLGTGTVKPLRRDTSRRITPDLLDFYIKRAHALREEWYRDMWHAIWSWLTRLH